MAKPRRKHPRTKLLVDCPEGARFMDAMHRALGDEISYEPLGYMRPDRVHAFDFAGSIGRGILFELDTVQAGAPVHEWHFAQRRIGVDVRGTWIIDLVSDGAHSTYDEHFEPGDDDDVPPTLFADFSCKICDGLAGFVAHVPPGESLPALSGGKQPDFVDAPRVVVWFGDELYFCVSHDHDRAYEAAREAVAGQDPLILYLAAAAFAPFFCPECAEVYCPAHWDATGGMRSCPMAHARHVTS
jgi:hypothetical protein